MSTRIDSRWAAAALGVCLPLAACSGSDDPPPPPGPDTTAPTVTATPASGVFAADQTVALSAVDDTDPAPVIYYTTDLSEPTEMSSVYSGTPIAAMDGTIVKFFAVDESDNDSDVEVEGYTVTTSPIKAQWGTSGHGAIQKEPWRHWDEDGEVETECAKCHSAEGFLDYCEDGTVDLAAALPVGLDCSACHSGSPTTYDDLTTYPELEPVAFPSGDSFSLHGTSNMCMTCHQGRASGLDVDQEIMANPAGPYEFINIHYYAAAASMFGGEALGGYQYSGQWYRPRNDFPSHPESYSTCVGCHMQNAENGEKHTWTPEVNSCAGCHGGTSFETLGGSPSQSYSAIQTLQTALLSEIELYAANTLGQPIMHDGGAYPYFFFDNGMGANFANRYTQFDASLLKAAYNFQVSDREPAGFVHNGTYIQQLLYDSITDLGGTPTVQVLGRNLPITMASKSQQWQISGHGDAGAEAFRHWDEDPEVDGDPDGCAKCHSTPGFVEFAGGNPVTGQKQITMVDCYACHNSYNLFADDDTRHDDLMTNPAIEPVTFPSGDMVTFNNASNMCMSCHQGRSSTAQVDAATVNDVVQMPMDYNSYDFINIHYYAAGASLFGSDVQGGYEYMGETYRGQNTFTAHGTALSDCTACHANSSTGAPAKHTFLPEVADCAPCHGNPPMSFETLSGTPGTNYTNIETLKGELLTAIQDYATAGLPNGLPNSSPIMYDGSAYPYWFYDNGMGADYGNRYRDFDFDMLTAAYNYVVASKEPGGFIHNGTYITQLLYDSIVAMGGMPSVMRP